jgi:hypothetical protein
MSDAKLHQQIYNNLKLKETDELLELWQANDRSEWSDETFEVVKELLQERGVDMPPQNEPVYERQDERLEDDGLEEWETRLLDDQNQPEFYDILDVLSLRDNLNKVAKASVIVYILIGLWNLPIISLTTMGIRFNFSDILQALPSMLVTIAQFGIRIAITYFPLKALAYILRILMEMEFKSRRAA